MAAAAPAPKPKKPPVYVLDRSRLQGGDFARATHYAKIPTGTPPEAIMQTAYWSACSARMGIGDHIECMWEDGTRYAELLVRFASPVTAIVTELRMVELDPIKVTPSSVYDIVFQGTSWAVIRKSDGGVEQAGMQTQRAAHEWASAHEMAMRR